MAKILGIQTSVFSSNGKFRIKPKDLTVPKEEKVSSHFSFSFLLFFKYKHILKITLTVSGAHMLTAYQQRFFRDSVLVVIRYWSLACEC